MAITGRPPKPPGQAVTRHASTTTWTEVEDRPYRGRVPALPQRVPGLETAWPRRTRSVWAAWSRMPHCILWSPADWQFAIDTVTVAALFHETAEPKYAAELRAREKVLGTTFDARQSLRIRYVEPEVKLRVKGGANLIVLEEYARL